MRRLGAIPCALVMLWGTAHAASIDMNDFFADSAVSVNGVGTFASFTEDGASSAVILSNDPFFGQLEVILAGPGVFLEFEYNFLEEDGGSDEFGVWVIDPDDGFSIGAPFEFFEQDSSSGTVSFDLSSLDGTTGLGLQFQLSSLPGDLGTGSTLEISNLRLVEPSQPIPEPATIMLLGAGLFGLAARRRFQKSS